MRIREVIQKLVMNVLDSTGYQDLPSGFKSLNRFSFDEELGIQVKLVQTNEKITITIERIQEDESKGKS